MAVTGAAQRARDLTRAPRTPVTAPRPRSPAVRVDPGRGGPQHALASVLPLLRDTLVAIADETTHRMIVADAQGHILWCQGRRDVPHRADGAGPVTPGAHHSWTCAACPVRDPGTGAVVGAVDVTGPERTLHPTVLALVVAVARLAEGHLAVRSVIRNERPRTPRDPGRAVPSTRLTITAR